MSRSPSPAPERALSHSAPDKNVKQQNQIPAEIKVKKSNVIYNKNPNEKQGRILLPSTNPNNPQYFKHQALRSERNEQKSNHPENIRTGFTPVISRAGSNKIPIKRPQLNDGDSNSVLTSMTPSTLFNKSSNGPNTFAPPSSVYSEMTERTERTARSGSESYDTHTQHYADDTLPSNREINRKLVFAPAASSTLNQSSTTNNQSSTTTSVPRKYTKESAANESEDIDIGTQPPSTIVENPAAENQPFSPMSLQDINSNKLQTDSSARSEPDRRTRSMKVKDVMIAYANAQQSEIDLEFEIDPEDANDDELSDNHLKSMSPRVEPGVSILIDTSEIDLAVANQDKNKHQKMVDPVDKNYSITSTISPKSIPLKPSQASTQPTSISDVKSSTTGKSVMYSDLNISSTMPSPDNRSMAQLMSVSTTVSMPDPIHVQNVTDLLNRNKNIADANSKKTDNVSRQKSHPKHISIDYKRAGSNLGVNGLFDDSPGNSPVDNGTPVNNKSDTEEVDEEELKHNGGFSPQSATGRSRKDTTDAEEEFSVSQQSRAGSIYEMKKIRSAGGRSPIKMDPIQVIGLKPLDEYEPNDDDEIQTPEPESTGPNKRAKFGNLHARNETNMSVQTVDTIRSSAEHKYQEGDFVDLILREANNLIVIGVIVSYNTLSQLADVKILPSRSHNRGNDLVRFVEARDLKWKGFRINDLAVLAYETGKKSSYPVGFDLDYDTFKKDRMFPASIVKGWEDGSIDKPSAFELFDGLKVRIKEVNHSGLLIVTILPSSRAQQYLLGQRSIKISIKNLMSLETYHERRMSNQLRAPPQQISMDRSSSPEQSVETFGPASELMPWKDISKDRSSGVDTSVEEKSPELGPTKPPFLATQYSSDRQATDRSMASTGGLQRAPNTEHAFEAIQHAETTLSIDRSRSKSKRKIKGNRFGSPKTNEKMFGDRSSNAALNTLDEELRNNPALTSPSAKKKSSRTGLFRGSIRKEANDSRVSAHHSPNSSLVTHAVPIPGSLGPSQSSLISQQQASKDAENQIFNNAFAADKDVIRDDFIQRRRIMMQHYNTNHHCKSFMRCIITLLCIYLSVWLITEMHLAKSSGNVDQAVGDVNNDLIVPSGYNYSTNDKCPYNYDALIDGKNLNKGILYIEIDNNALFESSIFSSMLHDPEYVEWYWLLFTLIGIIMYNLIVFFFYYCVFSCCMMCRQRCYKKCRIDPFLMPCFICYYSNRYRQFKVGEKQFEVVRKGHVAAIGSHGEHKKIGVSKCTFCMCCVTPQKVELSLSLEKISSKSNLNDGASNDNVASPQSKQEDYLDYGNADICYTMFCCYFRCFNFCHYGLHQGPNAPRLLAFFDPVKNNKQSHI